MKPPKSTRNDVFVQYKLWLASVSGEGIIGEGKVRLLMAIDELGSLSAAATSLGLSYRKAWGDIQKAEALLGYELTEKHRGGKQGGRSSLTPAGKRLLEAYHALRVEVNRNIDAAVTDFQKKIKE